MVLKRQPFASNSNVSIRSNFVVRTTDKLNFSINFVSITTHQYLRQQVQQRRHEFLKESMTKRNNRSNILMVLYLWAHYWHILAYSVKTN